MSVTYRFLEADSSTVHPRHGVRIRISADPVIAARIAADEVCFRPQGLKKAGTGILQTIQDQIGCSFRRRQRGLAPGIGHELTGYQVIGIPIRLGQSW